MEQIPLNVQAVGVPSHNLGASNSNASPRIAAGLQATEFARGTLPTVSEADRFKQIYEELWTQCAEGKEITKEDLSKAFKEDASCYFQEEKATVCLTPDMFDTVFFYHWFQQHRYEQTTEIGVYLSELLSSRFSNMPYVNYDADKVWNCQLESLEDESVQHTLICNTLIELLYEYTNTIINREATSVSGLLQMITNDLNINKLFCAAWPNEGSRIITREDYDHATGVSRKLDIIDYLKEKNMDGAVITHYENFLKRMPKL